MVQRRALAVTEDPREFDNAPLAGGNELLAGELGRGPQIAAVAPIRMGELGPERLQMDLIAGGHLQRRGLDLDEGELGKQVPQRAHDLAPHAQHGLPLGVNLGRPKGGPGVHR